MKKCSHCKKNMAMLFASTIEDGKPQMKGLCLECAKKLNIPGIDSLIKQTGITEEELQMMTEKLNIGVDEEDFDNLAEDMMEAMHDQQEEFLHEEPSHEEIEESVDPSPTIDENKKNKRSKKKTKHLDAYGTNLTNQASSGMMDPIIGRNDEIDRTIQILNRKNKNNPVLIGEPGVGKTAIAEGLASRIVEGKVPHKLLDAEVYLLDMTAIVAGTQFRGQFEGRMKSILVEAEAHGNVILVIDELHNIMGAGEVHGGTMNAANILKPSLAKGNIQILGATTLDEYRKHIEKDSALERRFQPVLVEEPTAEEAMEILEGLKPSYEAYHQILISPEVIEAAVKLSKRYITDRYLPDKAIDVIDEAGSRSNLYNHTLQEISELKESLEEIQEKKEQLAMQTEEEKQADQYEKAAYLKAEAIRLQERIDTLSSSAKTPLTVEDVAMVIEKWTKIPLKAITEKEAIRLLDLENRLHERIVSQEDAISAVARTIRRNRSGFRKRLKPSSFIFVGPTGVGKTQVVKTLAEELFGSEDDLIRIDMSEYMEKHTLSKLIGSPPGYVGYEEGGQLTEKVRRKPYSVILIDEIEKAHPDVFNILLQILEDGRLTDSQGRTVFFDNTVIIMTSNAGTSHHYKQLGFIDQGQGFDAAKAKEALKEFFRPEFLNRVDEIVFFDFLTKQEVGEILEIMLDEVSKEAEEQGISLHISQEVKDFLLDKGFDATNGARPLRRTVQRYIEDELAELYLKREIQKDDKVNVYLLDTKINFMKA